MKTTNQLDTLALELKVKDMYRNVALNPSGDFHFEMGRSLAEKLGYPVNELDRIPQEAIASFAGVGYYFDLADLKAGCHVLDLGSGSGMDSFIATSQVGNSGCVRGVDMTDEQLEKARRLAHAYLIGQVEFQKAYIESLPYSENSFDRVISNGVINLSPQKETVFAEIFRVLKPGGSLAIADIITEKPLPENVTCNATLWAACIGGAALQDDYLQAIEKAGLKVLTVRVNSAYGFISKSAQNASDQYGVKSVSLLAKKMPD